MSTEAHVDFGVQSGALQAAPQRLAAPADRSSERFNWPLVFLAFAVIAAIATGKAISTAATRPLLADTDDAMRLTTVRDLLGGQNWFDHIQHRLNAPFGAEIHWSHLVDAAIGGVILLLRPFAGGAAETVAVYVWPLLLLLALLILSARLAFRLAGRAAILPAVILPAASPVVMQEFSPGRIDHHSIQILLTLCMAWACIETIRRPRFALLAGGAAALSITIGIEGLPSIVSAILAIALIWVVQPAQAPAMRWFGLSFAAATLVLFAEAFPPSRWFETACDEISIVYLAFALGIGAVLTLLSILPLAGRAPWQRLALGGALAAMLAAALAKAFPLCLGGPYAALDPWLLHNWLDGILEARPIWDSLVGLFAFTVGILVPVALGLVVMGVRIWKQPKGRGEWLILALFLIVAIAVMCAQIRGARLAAPLAVPAAAWLIIAARQRYLSGQRVSGGLAMLGSWFGSAGLMVSLVLMSIVAAFDSSAAAAAAANGADQLACRMPAAFAALAKLPPARVMTPIDLGSHMLMLTPHSVVAAPYHRDQAGVLDTFHFFDGPIGNARQILDARGVTLVVVCPSLPEMRGLPDAAQDSFVRLFADGRLPNWLRETSGPQDVLKVYQVLPH